MSDNEVDTLKARLAEVEEKLHYVNGVADLAMKHRDAAEARIAVLEKTLGRIAVLPECGCKPCTGQCRSQAVLLIELEEIRALAAVALAAVGEPVAWRYRWKVDGEWTSWRVADHSQKSEGYLSSLEETPLYAHPLAHPCTSAAVLQSHALKQALDTLAEIAAARIPDCPAHYAGDELAWAQRHVGSLRHKAEIARNGIADAIRQLPTPERGDK